MPDSTRARIERELFLRSYFEDSPPSELAELLAERMRDRRFEPGELLYEQGQPSGPMFFISRGTVELYAPGLEPWVFEDRSLLGALDANSHRPHARSARAVTRVHAVEMHFEEYLMLLEDFFDFARAMVQQGARRAHETALQLGSSGMFRTPQPPAARWLERRELDGVHKLMVLKSSFAFAHAPVQPLVTLTRAAEERRFARGERIFGAGDTNKGLWFVAEGGVRIHHDDPKIDGLVGPGDMCLSLLGIVDEPYAYSATAASDVVLILITHEDLFDAMEENFGLVRAWWRYMGEENTRLREARAAQTEAPPVAV